MVFNKFLLASCCNDIENFDKYSIDGNQCYYEDRLIGEFCEKIENSTSEIYFKPYQTIEYININFTIKK